ncbi:MAG: MFS transporter [Planctomycetota bacterium]|nr:MAG: MFS transporter [Planctomycetota bacterium]
MNAAGQAVGGGVRAGESAAPAGAVAASAPSPASGRREAAVDARLLATLQELERAGSGGARWRLEPEAPLVPDRRLTVREAIRIFESQVIARHLDFEARAMRARGEGFYTIGSAGHEANACVAAALRPTDPALLHYRSGPFFVERARQRPGETPVFDVLLGLAASKEEPIAGGRHKVFGSATLAIPPQTSTIASHLPKAVGLAIAIERARRLELPCRYPYDSVVVCSFGDASLNHATAQAGLQAAGWAAAQGLPVPVLLVCEDNGIGISVPTPRDWVRRAMQQRAELRYFEADGSELAEAYEVCCEAVEYVRQRRRPAFVRLRVERLLGHAGSDIETTYRTLAEIEAVEARDPLVRVAQQLVAAGAASPAELRALYEETRERVAAAAREAARRPRLSDAAEIVAPLAPLDPEAVAAEAARAPAPEALAPLLAGSVGRARPRHLAVLINEGLRELLAKYPEMLVFGEDVGKKGGVYHVTAELQARAGRARVFDTLLDETSILGLAIGAGMAGLLPCPEIQYLAYVHNALDQLRGEACSLQFFSQDQYRNPMVVRIAALGYQKGFGGHFHNDNSTAALRDIPGLIVACPSRGDDAVRMLRALFAAARVCGRVAVFLEPIALYMRKDLEPGDGAWQFRYPAEGEHVPIGQARLYVPDDPLLTGGGREPGAAALPARAPRSDAEELLIITYGNGVPMALLAARRLRAERGARVRVLDLRWLQPLDEEAIVANAAATGNVLVVDEGRRSGGVAEPVLALLLERRAEIEAGGRPLRAARVAGLDTYIPLGDAAELCLPSMEQVLAAARRLLGAGGAG